MSVGTVMATECCDLEVWAPEELLLTRIVVAPEPEPEPEPGAVAVAAEDAEARAAEEQAAAEAARQMAEALEAKYREGYEAGHAAGYAAGHQAGRDEGARAEAARLESAVRAVEEAARAVRSAEAERLAAIEDDLLVLALAAARQIVGKAVELEPEIVADVVRRAIAHFPGEQPLVIRVNPEDLSALTTTTAADGGPIAIAPGRDVRWMADPQIARGGCIVEGKDRIVDGRVDLALERAYWMLRDG
ncbi:MAG: FliH/SctL family protein [bacterium]